MKDTMERVNPETEWGSLERYLVYLRHMFAYDFAARLAEGTVCLDVGCGLGYGIAALSQYARHAVGVDVDFESLHFAQRRPDANRPLFCQFDNALPFPDNTFDTVVSFQVIEHVVPEQEWLGEIQRIVKPRGTLLLTTPNREIRSYFFQPPLNPCHVREYDHRQLEAALLPFFQTVNIFGVFGKREIQDVEVRRLRRYRSPVTAGKQIVKRFLPKAITRVLRQILWPYQSRGKVLLDRDALRTEMERFKPDDFYVSEAELRQSLDLLAICQKQINDGRAMSYAHLLCR